MYEYITDAQVGDTIHIPPSEIGEIIGWEFAKCDVVIDTMVQAVECGDNFPPVPVLVLFDGTLMLTSQILNIPGRNGEKFANGGHHRAVAYYIADKCMPVTIAGKPDELNSMILQASTKRIKIRDIEIDDYTESHLYKMETDRTYREAYIRLNGVPKNWRNLEYEEK